jgi:hypothetical protein
LDARPNSPQEQSLDENMRNWFAGKIGERGYRTEPANWARTDAVPVLPEHVSAGTRLEEIIPFLPPGPEPVVVIRLNEMAGQDAVVAKEGLGVVSAWVIDPTTGSILWMDRTTSTTRYDGADPVVTTMVMFWDARASAVHDCINVLSESLPPHASH